MFWWIIGIIGVLVLLFLWVVVRRAAHSVDDETQAMLDEEQTQAVEEYLRKKNRK